MFCLIYSYLCISSKAQKLLKATGLLVVSELVDPKYTKTQEQNCKYC